MKENIFDVLVYVFEQYLDAELEQEPDADAIYNELIEAGYPQPEINQAFDWLESLTEHQAIRPVSSGSMRIYSSYEMNRLDTECRGLLLFLEQSGILTPACREIVLDRVLDFDEEVISMENLKWIVLMVLFSQPDQEQAFARMETLVYDNQPNYLH
jgi:Smg protein